MRFLENLFINLVPRCHVKTQSAYYLVLTKLFIWVLMSYVVTI